MVAPLMALGACAGSTAPSDGDDADDAGIAPSPDEDAAKPPSDVGDAGPPSTCTETNARIEADVQFDGRTIHFSSEAKRSVDGTGTRLETFAPDDAGFGFPFGLMIGFPSNGIAVGERYPQFFDHGALYVGILYEDAASTGPESSLIDRGSITFSEVGTGDCHPTVGIFESIEGFSDGPEHPFSVRATGSFRSGAR